MFTIWPRADGLTLARADQQSVSRSSRRPQRSKVRRAQIRIHRHPRKSSDHALLPRRQSVQDPRRHHQGQGAAEVRLHGDGEHRLSCSPGSWTKLSKRRLNTVTGYQGGSEIDIAVERGEIVCRGMDIPPHFGREPFDGWHKRGFDRHILQSGPKRDPRMARRADPVRTDGSIQNSRSHARCTHG